MSRETGSSQPPAERGARRGRLDHLIRKLKGTSSTSRITRRDESATIPLSTAQRRLWLLDRLDPGAPTYNLAAALRLRGALDLDALHRSLRWVVERHEVLRTRFVLGADDEPVQEVVATDELWPTGLVTTSAVDDETLATRLHDAARHRFSLDTGPLIRFELLALADHDHRLALTVHHTVADGWSIGVFCHELAASYNARVAGNELDIEPLPIQVGDVAVWEEGRKDSLLAGLGWWRDRLTGLEPLELPGDRSWPATPSSAGARSTFSISSVVAERLRTLGRQLDATLFQVVLAAFAAYLGRLGDRDDLAVGTPVAGRSRPELEGLIGTFVNTLALRLDLSGQPTVVDLVARARDVVTAAQDHAETPFELLVAELAPQRGAVPPLVQTLLTVVDTPPIAPDLSGLDTTLEPLATDTAKVDLQIELTARADGGFDGWAEYATARFDAPTIATWMDGWVVFLDAAAHAPHTMVHHLPVMTSTTERRVLEQWSGATVNVSTVTDTLIGRVVDQAARTPDQVALVDGDRSLTYAELMDRVWILARYLRDLRVRSESVVGVCLDRESDMVATILATHAVGAAYVALDPSYPQDRLSFLLVDTEATVIVGRSASLAVLDLARPPGAYTHTGTESSAVERRILVVDLDEDIEYLERYSSRPLALLREPDHLSHLIYTSGSTGRPKGIAITHRSACAMLDWAVEAYDDDALGGSLATTSINFDVSIFEIFAPLSTGGTVILGANALDVVEHPHRDIVTMVTMVPSAMAEVLQLADLPAETRVVNLPGEPLRRALVDAVFANAPKVDTVWNLYGPSEDTTYSTAARLTRGEQGEPTIGRPLPGTFAYVLDRELRPVAPGALGELYLGGAGVSRGYLRRCRLTADRYVPDPFTADGARMYRTGDRVRWRHDGELVFFGRVDHQIKLRGYRIELGEIEARLLGFDETVEAVAQVVEIAGAPRLVAWVGVQGVEPTEVDETDWLGRLSQKLPPHMVPERLVVLDKLPHLPNGKVDRRSLPLPIRLAETTTVAPRTSIEATIAGVFAKVLAVDRVGVEDDFFALGGHSLLATRAVVQLRRTLGIEISLSAFFAAPNVAALAMLAEGASGEAEAPITLLPREPDDAGHVRLPASFAQARLWFLDQLEPGSSVYNLPLGARLRGVLDVDRLARALDRLVSRHESLRTGFDNVAGQPVQVIHAEAKLDLAVHDLSGASDVDQQLATLTQRLHGDGFDLSRPPLLRAALVRLGTTEGGDEHILLLAFHHIVADGWSLGIFVSELATLYGADDSLAPLAIQVADAGAWQQTWLEGERFDRQLAYWRTQLDALPVLELPTDRPRRAQRDPRGGVITDSLDPALVTRIDAVASAHGTTRFVVLLAVFQVLLARWSGQRDFAIGSPVANRRHPDFEGLIGFFVNTLVLRAELVGEPSFAVWLARTHATVLAAQDHQDLPFERLVEHLAPDRDLASTPFFQVLFALQNAPLELEMGGIDLEVLAETPQDVKTELGLSLYPDAHGGLTVSVRYAAALFSEPRIERLLDGYRRLLDAAVTTPTTSVFRLPLVDPVDAHRMRIDFNATESAYTVVASTLHDMVWRHIERHPDRLAVVLADDSLTYAELGQRTAHLAHRLRALGAGPETLVVVSLERSFDLVIAILATLTTGAAYLPLDPAQPEARRQQILDDASAAMPVVAILTQAELVDSLPTVAAEVLVLDHEADDLPDDNPSEVRPIVAVEGDSPAYVIYTSGSTGRPKGVVITHAAIANRLSWVLANERVESQLAKTSIGFDLSVAELFSPLVSGGRVVLAPRGQHTDDLFLLDLIASEAISQVSFLPSQLAILVEQGGLRSCPSLRQVVTGGETVPPELPARVLEQLGDEIDVISRYGPTETCISVVQHHCRIEDRHAATLPIGKPFGGAEIFIVDVFGELVPPGVAGEILIGGICLARGYLGAAIRTATAFVPHPWSDQPGARLYRSGDLGRWRDDGVLEFLGRIDGQIKVRGHRVEIGEIEAVLLERPGVRQGVVVDYDDPATGSRRLAAFVVLDPEHQGASTLRDSLAERLPSYMVPAVIVELDVMPLTRNGKVDRRALPEPAWGEASGARRLPSTTTEARVHAIWAEILEREAETIGIDDDFFALGGHSLLATRLVSRMRETLGVDVPLRELFATPTVAALAQRVDETGTQTWPTIEVLERAVDADGRVRLPASSAQERLWFLDQLDPGNTAYNMPFGVRLRGRLDVDALQRAVTAVVERHEVLRTRFVAVDGRPVQVIEPSVVIDIDVEEGSATFDQAIENVLRVAAETRFDLAAAPLLKLRLLRLGTTDHVAADCVAADHVLIATFHHIVSDGWSMGVFLRELGAFYDAFVRSDEPSLAPLAIQVADAAAWQRAWLSGARREDQLAYWRQQLDGLPTLELPTDRARGTRRATRGATVSMRIDPPPAMETFLQASGATRFALFLATFQLVLARLSGARDFAVGIPTTNRRHPDLEPLIGFFVNTLVIRTDFTARPTFAELVTRTRDAVLAAQDHQDLPFETLVETLAPERDLAGSPLVQVMFSTAMTPEADVLPGLVIEPLDTAPPEVKLELGLTVVEETDRSLTLVARYAVDLFDRSRIERLLAHVQTALVAGLETPNRPAFDVPLLDAATERLLRTEMGLAPPVESLAPTLHGLVRRQIDKQGDAIAVVTEDETLTYRELGARASSLAHQLREHGAGPETLVAVAVERSVDLAVALLGTLESGAAYVPLDVAQPIERLAAIVADAERHLGIAVLLTQSHLRASLPTCDAPVIEIDAIDFEDTNLETDGTPPDVALDPAMPAYVLYTSGSTGTPKGVVMSHAAVASRLSWVVANEHTSRGAVLAKTSIGFDVSVGEVFSPLVCGGRLIVARPDGHTDVPYLLDLVTRHDVTQVAFLPSQLAVVAEMDELDACRSLRAVITGGETVPPDLPARVMERVDVEVHNRYGPTETCISVIMHVCSAAERDTAALPIGTPIAGAEILIVDATGALAPIGVAGEILIGGITLARGYLGDPARTAAAFVPHPWSEEPGARLYRSGDLGRWRDDGAVEFLGRIDGQVKVRGHRVELGEIQAVLRDQETVADAVVVDFEDRSTHSRRLAAFIVPVSDGVDLAALRGTLADRLPSYMVPSAFVVVERIPLTANGKVDRRALPEPDWTETRGERVAPRNDLERTLSSLWADVLGLDEADFGVDDDFFALGGHSLLATQVVSRIRHELEVEIALRRLFETPTIAGLAIAVDEAQGAALPPIEAVERRPNDDGTVTFPVSFAQERLWFLARLEPDSPAYHIPTPVRLRGPVDLDRLATALQNIVDRHESLRTVFRERDGVPMQVIVPTLSVDLPIDEVDEDSLLTRVADESKKPFDLARGPLLRARIFRLADDDHVLALTVHHIVSDGWSTGVLIRELVALYDGSTPLAPLVTQVPDVAMWQREHLAARLDEQIDWWREQLAGVPVLDLPTDHPRPAVQTWAGDSLPFALPARVVAPLDDLARAEGATPFMALLTAISVVLGRWSGQDDFAIGTPIAGRNRAEMEPLIGFFVNTLALRVDLDGNPSFRTLLGRIRETTLGAYAHQDVPFERLVAALEPNRDPAHPPLFQTAVSLQNAPFERVSLGDDVAVEPVIGSSTTAKYDLVVALGPGHDGDEESGLEGTIEWNTDLFDRSTIERLAAHLEHLLEQAVDTPDLPISRLPLEPSRQRLESAGPRTDYPRDSHLIEQFLGTVQADPDGIALMYEDIRITRAELARRARLQARALRKRGVGWEDPVALFAERSPDMVVSMLAILASGGYYVPLDPTDPDERLTYILDDTLTRVVVAEPRLASRLPAALDTQPIDTLPIEIVPLDAWKAEEDNGEADDAWPEIDPQSLAYIIYTSGSTGRPKGVTGTHRNVLRLVVESGFADLGPEQTYSHLASPAFDAAAFEIWAALLSGGRLVLPPSGAMSLQDIGALLSGYDVTSVVFTTSVFHQMVDHRLDDLRGVRQVIIGGEALSVRHASQALAELDTTTLINAYGPTENTVATSSYSMPPGTELDSATVPIGTPIANTTVYVLDGELMPTPVGIPGELYTGGDGVARGYLRRPALTAERFVPDPFATEPGARLYRTGDRGRWRADGTVEFLGRVDRQVKLRGFRIEPGEIEAALTSYTGVRAALAMVREDQPGDRRLVAYVEPDTGHTLDIDTLRAHVRPRVPSYMVPAAIVALDVFPLTRNGKVDRRALPAPEWQDKSEYVAPSTDTERTVAAIYADVLGVERVGRHDDFFATGGHSLLATQVVSQILGQLGVEIPLRQLFESPDVAGLAAVIDAALESSDGRPALPPITYVERPVAADGSVHFPLSFAQERLWFLAQLEPDSPAYHIPSPVRLRGVVDAERLAAALGAIVERHESLRTVFREIDGTPMQVVLSTSTLELPSDEIDESELVQAVGEETRRPFDLARGPLLRARLFRLASDDHVLALTVHHIVYDGWSMEVLIRELVTFYGDPSTVMPALEVQYPDVTVWQREHLAPRVEEQVTWWRERLAGVPVLELPTDRPRPAVQTWAGDAASVVISEELTESLEGLVQAEGGTVFMGLLAIFSALLGRWSGQNDFAIGTPIAGRTRAEMEPLIGFFINTLVLRVDLEGDPTLRQLLERARETTLDAYSHQDVPFERLVAELEPDRDLAHPPLFQVMLSLQNAPFEQVSLDEEVMVEPVSSESTTAKFDLQLSFGQSPDGLRGGIEWNTDLFDRTTIERFLGHFQSLLEQAITAPDRPLSSFELRSKDEIATLERFLAGPEPVSQPAATIEGLIAVQAEKTPEREAILDEESVYTYAEVVSKSRQLARHLRTPGIGPEVCVGVCMDRSVDLVVALLAVLEAGGAYAPLDPSYPADRLSFMLEDSRAPVVLTKHGCAEILPEHTALVVDLADDPAAAYDDGPLGLAMPDDRLAYLIYTSGSTGKPKGVAINHRSAVVMLGWGRDTFTPDLLEGLYAATSINFDVSVFELFGTLSLGGTIIIGADALAAIDHPRRDRVRIFSTVPSAIAELIRADGVPPSTRAINVGGEPVYRTLAEAVHAQPNVEAFYNMYGPSEDTTYTSVALIPQGVEHGEPTVGKPIHGDRLYVVDSELRQVPLGVRGELYIGGHGISRGYLHRPGLTAERYVPDPFASEPGARLYRTGDRVRWRADGELLFEGRFDFQVKIRGHRVELGEIEAALLEQPSVRDAVVMARGDGADKRLIAWITAADHIDGELDVAPLRIELGERLPGYMVPSAFVVLDRLPLLPNEKVDRKRLPTPEPTRSERVYVAPRTPLERQIAALFAEVLGVEQVGVEDDFFALGGHSLLATRLVSALRRELGIEVPLRQLFDTSDVAGLARAVERLDGSEHLPPITAIERQPTRDGSFHLPLSFAQERLWFQSQLEPDSPAYNIPSPVRLRGPIDVERLARALSHVVARHETLR
ncbi:MAG: non-ribosomal peptide synthase/polyketide synthase, partial [Acidobacteriota bacterium]